MCELALIRDVLLGSATNIRIPKVVFRIDDLAQEAIRIAAGDSAVADESDDQQLVRWLKEIGANFNSEDIKADVDFDTIELSNPLFQTISNKLYEKLTESTDTLKNIRSDVEGIIADIKAQIDKALSGNEFVTTYLVDAAKTCNMFDIFPYAIVDKLGSVTSIINYIASVTGQSAEAILQSRSSFDIAVDKFIAVKLQNSSSIKADDSKVVLTADQTAKLVDGIRQLTKNELTDEQISLGIFLACDPAALRNKLEAIRYAIKYTEVTDQCIELITTIQTCQFVAANVALVAANMDDISAENKQLLDTYSAYAASLAELAALVVQWNRAFFFKNTLVFRNKMLNPDKLTEMKEANITYDDVALHLRMNYASTPISSVGISLPNLVSNKTRLAEAFAKKMAQDELRYKAIVVRTEQEAFVAALYKYLSIDVHREQVEFDDELRRFLIKQSAAMATYGAACTDVVYDTVISLLHNNSFVAMLHNKLGVKYVAMVANNEQLSACDVNIANATVYAELVTDLMFDLFMKKDI